MTLILKSLWKLFGFAETFVVLLVFCFTSSVWACVLNEPKEIFKAIVENHPDLKTAKSKKMILQSGLKQAQQRPNPQLNFTTNHGNRNEFSQSETTGSLQYVFELGNKRGSRVNKAKSVKELGETRINNRADEITVEAIIEIERLIQVVTLIDLYLESLDVFKKMSDTLKQNNSLSPEQQIQLDIVDIEVSKHQLRIAKLESEKSEIKTHLEYLSNSTCSISISKFRYAVPEQIEMNLGLSKIPKFKVLENQIQLAEKNLNLEKSLSYPDLKIGPSFQIEDSRGPAANMFGFQLTLDLPILNRNAGGVELASREKKLVLDQL